MRAPFPYFGGKRSVADAIWKRFGTPKQYIEPFCGSAAVLLAAPKPAPLEVIGDLNYYVANFWRATKYQPEAVAEWANYAVSHVDLAARHRWLTDPDRTRELSEALESDPEWPGDAQIAGWWLWGQCCWIGSGWCDTGQIPHASNAARGYQSHGQIPHASSAGMGYQSHGQISHASNAGRGTTHAVALRWLGQLSSRLERTRIVHGSWDRCLNRHYGGDATAVLLDPPYVGYERLYGDRSKPTAKAVAEWAAENGSARVALCGHVGDYDMPGWTVMEWSRAGNTYGGTGTKDAECVWFSPGCLDVNDDQLDMFGDAMGVTL